MVRFTADDSWLDDVALAKIDDVVRNRGRLFKITASSNEAAKAKRQLEGEGKHVRIETSGGMFKVMTYEPSCIRATRQVMAGMRQIGDGLYQGGMDRQAGAYDYAFDDGAIWRLETLEDGEYLVKEVSDQDDDVVIRQASAQRVGMVTGDNYRLAMALVYGGVDDRLMADVEVNQPLKRELVAMLNTKVEAMVDGVLRQHRLASKVKVTDALRRAIATSGATTVDDLTKVILRVSGRG